MLKVNENTMDAYKQKAKAQIKEMKAKMQVFEAQAEKAGADMRVKYEKNLTDWKSRFDDIDMRLDKLSDASEDAWEEIRTGIDKTMNELSNAIDNAKKQFNK